MKIAYTTCTYMYSGASVWTRRLFVQVIRLCVTTKKKDKE